MIHLTLVTSSLVLTVFSTLVPDFLNVFYEAWFFLSLKVKQVFVICGVNFEWPHLVECLTKKLIPLNMEFLVHMWYDYPYKFYDFFYTPYFEYFHYGYKRFYTMLELTEWWEIVPEHDLGSVLSLYYDFLQLLTFFFSYYFFEDTSIIISYIFVLKLVVSWFVVVWLRLNLLRFRFDQVASYTWHELVIFGIVLLVEVIICFWVL